MMKLSILISARETVVAPVRRIRAAIRGMVVTGTRDVARLDAYMKRLGETANKVGRFIGRSIRAGVLGATAAATGLVASVIRTASKFEQFQVVLEGTEGSAGKARAAMAWVQNFAKTTPYELGEVMESFVQLRAYGIDPTHGALMSLGNAASGMNKGLMQAVEMLADAQTGEFERLKEFGIKANAKGSQITLSYMQNGKAMTKIAKKNAADIQKAVLGIFDERFAGMMDRQSKTLGGLWSNLKDMISATQIDIANAGFFAFVKGQLQQLLDWVNKLAASGALKAWAKQVSDALVQLGRAVVGFDWKGFLRDVGDAARVLGAIGRAILWFSGGLRGLIDLGVAAIITRMTVALYGFGAALGIVSIAGAPLWAIVAVIGLLAFGAYKLITNWSKVSTFFSRMWADWLAVWKTGVATLWNSLPAWMRGILTGAAFIVRTIAGGGEAPFNPKGGAGGPSLPGGPRLGPPVARSQPLLFPNQKTAPAQVGGKISIELLTAPGTQARVTRMSSSNSNVPLDVTRGRVATGG